MRLKSRPLLKRQEIRRSAEKTEKTAPIASSIQIKKQDAFEFLTGLEPGSVDLLVSSPPYCMGKAYETSINTADFISMHERLPWTTTKGSINEDSLLWQEAKRHMIVMGRTVTSFLDKVYSDSGTTVDREEMSKLSGPATDAFSAATAAKNVFKPPLKKGPKEVKIQYNAKETDIQKIRKHLSKPNLSGSEVGRYTFTHFLTNEVGSE
jgi:hypothetical protein